MVKNFEDGDGNNSHTLTIFVRDEDEVGSILSVINIAVSEHDVNEAPDVRQRTQLLRSMWRRTRSLARR